MKNKNLYYWFLAAALTVTFANFTLDASAQETPPAPAAPKAVKVPAVRERKMANNLTVAVVERRGVPVVTVELLVKRGAADESAARAGLANMTASLLTKGTTSRTATQIAEQIEFLGGSINTGAGWTNSVVYVNVMSSKLDQALAVMSDVVLNPSFKQEEIDLLKQQTLDGLTYNLKQPGFLATYVASRYSYNEHPAGGTPDSLNAIRREDIAGFYRDNYAPANAVLIFTGDITAAQANLLAQKYFGKWNNKAKSMNYTRDNLNRSEQNRILVVDLPGSGQAAVNYSLNLGKTSRTSAAYFPATVLNSVLGGGYSSRLNQEIRINRGLSYGAGSGFSWRSTYSNFGTRTQTKNESAAEVAELVMAEINKLSSSPIADTELVPRKSVLTGGFGRNLETTDGLAAAVADLYSFGLPASQLNAYTRNVEAVTDAQIRDFARGNLSGGDLVIVGDYAKFRDDLAKRFPNAQVQVIPAANLDLSRDNLRN